MNLKILLSNDPDIVTEYVRGKFQVFDRFYRTRAYRIERCIQYYNATFGQHTTPQTAKMVRGIIESTYQQLFKEMFPLEEAAEVRNKSGLGGNHKMSSNDWLNERKVMLCEAELKADLLKAWLRECRYQEGERFLFELQNEMAFIEPNATKSLDLRSEYQCYLQKSLTSNVMQGTDQYRAEFGAMIGIDQKAKVRFDAECGEWGTINAKLDESFKAGLWSKGSAAGKLTSMGFSADVQAAIVIGAHLLVDADCVWKSNGKLGLSLAGKCDVLAGASAQGKLRLEADVLKGLNLALQAEAFAGFRASVSGTCSLQYDGKSLITAGGTAGIAVGVGGSIEAKFKTSIFGATEMSLKTTAALGVGVTVGGAVAIDFNGIYLASADQFRTLVYLPTILKGYKMDLMSQDAKNLYYLNRSIARLEEYRVELRENIDSWSKMRTDQKSLLK